jgi:hypothetical protein
MSAKRPERKWPSTAHDREEHRTAWSLRFLI